MRAYHKVLEPENEDETTNTYLTFVDGPPVDKVEANYSPYGNQGYYSAKVKAQREDGSSNPIFLRAGDTIYHVASTPGDGLHWLRPIEKTPIKNTRWGYKITDALWWEVLQKSPAYLRGATIAIDGTSRTTNNLTNLINTKSIEFIQYRIETSADGEAGEVYCVYHLLDAPEGNETDDTVSIKVSDVFPLWGKSLFFSHETIAPSSRLTKMYQNVNRDIRTASDANPDRFYLMGSHYPAYYFDKNYISAFGHLIDNHDYSDTNEVRVDSSIKFDLKIVKKTSYEGFPELLSQEKSGVTCFSEGFVSMFPEASFSFFCSIEHQDQAMIVGNINQDKEIEVKAKLLNLEEKVAKIEKKE